MRNAGATVADPMDPMQPRPFRFIFPEGIHVLQILMTRILSLMDSRDRRQFYFLVGLAVVNGVFSMFGVAAILPFLAVVSDPSRIDRSGFLSGLRDLSGLESVQGFTIFLGVLVFLFMLLSVAVRAFTSYMMLGFTRMQTLTLAQALMRHYMSQNYSWFLRRHSSDLAKTILSEVAQVVNQVISGMMRLLANGMMILFMLLFLVALDPGVAVAGFLIFGVSFGLIHMLTRKYISRMGKERLVANGQMYKILNEALSGIKNVKLRGLEGSYLGRFETPARKVADSQVKVGVLSELPRHLLEVVAFGGMILFILWLLAVRQGDIADVIPILGVFALAAARMFPTLQQFFSALSMIRFGRPALDQLYDELSGSDESGRRTAADVPAIGLRSRLQLDEVGFAFPDTDHTVLQDISLAVEAGTTVGIVGTTGAGKTTLVDLLLGLLPPTSGTISVDGAEITPGNVRGWQKSVGYVPQDIFIVDDTVAANIAFGVPPEKIDREAVVRAAKVAELDAFVTEQLPQGYDTTVGERGTRLSGGQRQRLGIARAIYLDPDLLILDEATSALDTVTEMAVMDAIHRFGGERTIVMIAHRLSTVRNCDIIFMLERGHLVASGRYDDLVAGSTRFRALHDATT